MKKIVCLILLAVLGVSHCVVGLADTGTTNWSFGFTAYTDGENYTHANQWQTKQTSLNYIEVRHKVVGDGSSALYTNRICAAVPVVDAVVYAGGKWHSPNMSYYKCTSDTIQEGVSVTPGGRGNTKYKQNLDLDSIRIEGQFRTH